MLSNVYTIPEDDYRADRMWALLTQLSEFVLKVDPSRFYYSFDNTMSEISKTLIDLSNNSIDPVLNLVSFKWRIES